MLASFHRVAMHLPLMSAGILALQECFHCTCQAPATGNVEARCTIGRAVLPPCASVATNMDTTQTPAQFSMEVGPSSKEFLSSARDVFQRGSDGVAGLIQIQITNTNSISRKRHHDLAWAAAAEKYEFHERDLQRI